MTEIQPYVIKGTIAGAPIVYVHRLGNASVDYIGYSAPGLGRPLGGGHIKIAPDDALVVLPCASPEEAATLEKTLITVLHPRRNVCGRSSGRSRSTDRSRSRRRRRSGSSTGRSRARTRSASGRGGEGCGDPRLQGFTWWPPEQGPMPAVRTDAMTEADDATRLAL